MEAHVYLYFKDPWFLSSLTVSFHVHLMQSQGGVRVSIMYFKKYTSVSIMWPLTAGSNYFTATAQSNLYLTGESVLLRRLGFQLCKFSVLLCFNDFSFHCCFSILFEFGFGFLVDFIDLKSLSGVINVLIVLFVLQKICMICMVFWQTFLHVQPLRLFSLTPSDYMQFWQILKEAIWKYCFLVMSCFPTSLK